MLIDLMPRLIALPVAPHGGQDVLDRSRRLAAAFRAAGRPVVLIRVDRPNVAEQPPGSGFADGLVQEGDITLVKGSIGAFATTDLEARLKDLGADTLVLGGLMTNMGVESTARVASDLDFELEFVEDAMSALTAEEHEFAVRVTFPRFGKVTEVADYL
ncbi:hydrolase [Catenulispora subtropica]|uniref:Hydrolase n=1 Tax=Catenulispora subtropica TaxID=450798 RepID=A0ABP5DGE7_9ACTN